MNIFSDLDMESIEKLNDYFFMRLRNSEDDGYEFGIHQYKWFLMMLEQEYIKRICAPEPEPTPKKKKRKAK